MSNIIKKGKKPFCPIAVHALIILPAIVLGMFAMIKSGVSMMIWAQQAAAFVMFLLLAVLLGKRLAKIHAGILAAALMAALTATLFGPVAGGARRWLDLGPFTVNAAMLVLPALLALLADKPCLCPLLLGAAAVLAIQPDVSQLAAMASASVPLLWYGAKKWSVPFAAALAALMLYCMGVPVTIEPVAYSEGVMSLLQETSWLLMAAGTVFLALIPAIWVYRFFREKRIWMLSLAIYYAVITLFALSGAYPMPFMGFGLSPIAGYWLSFMLVPEDEEGISC